MEIKVLNQNGSGDSNVSLPESVFGQDFNADLVHQLITTYIANGHQNTKGQKNRSAVRGGGKKPWKFLYLIGFSLLEKILQAHQYLSH